MSKKKFCNSCGKLTDYNESCSCKSDTTEYKKYKRNYYEKNKDDIKMLNSARWRKLRLLIINRDGGHCQRCYIKYGIINSKSLQVHHIKPRSEFPELMFNELNLIALCKTCNLQIGTNPVLDFKPKINHKDDFEFNL